MGKRKKAAKKPTGPRKKEALSTTFQCLFCNHEDSVTVKMEKKLGVGHLQCKVCGQTFQTGINYLSSGVDVYADWVDACDAVAKEASNASSATAKERQRNARVSSRAPRQTAAAGDGEMDGFIEDDEVDAEGEFADDG
ncbi:Elf1-domain-containing protein [Patellaria atrata CBS 101060]|uniref:Transcription elongation factor 1 homolog n=1 Tax=Patellaria atrata CBS 101060 TaxID=1346257 RepID=A0A9P4VV96_9PEZI|nr:Elf1-domain-containing protein [Patellaria atrata CBS 101060]